MGMSFVFLKKYLIICNCVCVTVYGCVHVIAGALDPEAGSPRAGVLGSSVLSDMGPGQHLLLTPVSFILGLLFVYFYCCFFSLVRVWKV